MNRLLRYIVDLMFPPRCAVCGEVTLIGTELCGKCFNRLKSQFSDIELCSRCGKPADSCICHNIPSVSAIISVFEYCNDTAKLIEKLKSDASSPAAAQLAQLMAKRFLDSFLSTVSFDSITYVPSGKGRVSSKGFNHAQRLAEQLSLLLGIPCFAPPIEQNSQYRTQHTLDRAERVSNVSNGYELSYGKNIGKTVLLIDDITTTGATLNRCAELLKSCGTDKVYCITAATTFMHHRE